MERRRTKINALILTMANTLVFCAHYTNNHFENSYHSHGNFYYNKNANNHNVCHEQKEKNADNGVVSNGKGGVISANITNYDYYNDGAIDVVEILNSEQLLKDYYKNRSVEQKLCGNKPITIKTPCTFSAPEILLKNTLDGDKTYISTESSLENQKKQLEIEHNACETQDQNDDNIEKISVNKKREKRKQKENSLINNNLRLENKKKLILKSPNTFPEKQLQVSNTLKQILHRNLKKFSISYIENFESNKLYSAGQMSSQQNNIMPCAEDQLYKNSDYNFIYVVNIMLKLLLHKKLDIKQLLAFALDEFVFLFKNSTRENIYKTKDNQDIVNDKKRKSIPDSDQDTSHKKRKTCITSKNNTESLTNDVEKAFADYTNNMCMLNHVVKDFSGCDINRPINNEVNQALSLIAHVYGSYYQNKCYIYCKDQNYWLYEGKYVEFLFFDYNISFEDSTTKKAFNARNIIDKFFCSDMISIVGFAFSNYFYHGFINHYLTFNSIYRYFVDIMPTNNMNPYNVTISDLKDRFLGVINSHEKIIELIAPQLLTLESFFSRDTNVSYILLSAKETYVYICFLQLFEILLNIKWQNFWYIIKNQINKINSKFKIKSKWQKRKLSKKHVETKIRFYNSFKIYFNDISTFLLHPYLDPNTLTRYVSLFQWQKLHYIKTFVSKKILINDEKIKITYTPIQLITRFFFANEIYILELRQLNSDKEDNLNTDGGRIKKSFNQNSEGIFSKSNFAFYKNNTNFKHFTKNWERIKILVKVWNIYLGSTSEDWQKYKRLDKEFDIVLKIIESMTTKISLEYKNIPQTHQKIKPQEKTSKIDFLKNLHNSTDCDAVKTDEKFKDVAEFQEDIMKVLHYFSVL
ncbi:hypothetical protein COBT_000803 [Conglomerata obtusa]